jgi:hypothetical protein
LKPNSKFERHRTRWEAAVSRLRNSRNRLEEGSCLRTHLEPSVPILLSGALIGEHIRAKGYCGSGKTSRVLTPPVAQLFGGGNGAVIIIDLKCDRSHLEEVRQEALKAGRTFKYCTNVLGLSSFVFNSYQQLNSKTTSIAQTVETIMESLRMNHGDGYGTRYFSVQGRQWLVSNERGRVANNPAVKRGAIEP